MAVKKVLVVDDEVHIVHVVAIKLRNNGYDVIVASNGAEAYELVCDEKPDIVVTDCQMPLLSGLELIEKLRSGDAARNLPVILLTAGSFEIEEDEKKRLKISCCLSKPFSPKELLAAVEDVLYNKVTSK